MENRRGEKRKKQLSGRLSAVAGLVTPGLRVADVGCDHAYVSIYLVEQGIARSCLAADLREGPLGQAAKNIRAHGLDGQIETRLSAGLSAVEPGEVDAVLMAGMGGILIRDILWEGRAVAGGLREWVLQPQSDVALVRRYIREVGWQIVREDMVKEDGKYYPMFRAEPGRLLEGSGMSAGRLPSGRAARLQPVFDRFGALLLEERNPVLKEFLEYGWEHYTRILREMEAQPQAGERLSEMRQEAEYVQLALGWYQ